MQRERNISIPENILRLQLSKPRHWNWELSTSKSSPHIPLPVIQLYDHRKRLLIETKPYDRKSWHVTDSVDYKLNMKDKIRIREHILLKKSKSEVLSHQPSRQRKLKKDERTSVDRHLINLKDSEQAFGDCCPTELNEGDLLHSHPNGLSRLNKYGQTSMDRRKSELEKNEHTCINRNKSKLKNDEQSFVNIRPVKLTKNEKTFRDNLSYSHPSSFQMKKDEQIPVNHRPMKFKKDEHIFVDHQPTKLKEDEQHLVNNVAKTHYILRSSNAGTLLISEDLNESANTTRRRRRRTKCVSASNLHNDTSSDSDCDNNLTSRRHSTKVPTRSRRKYEQRKSKSTNCVQDLVNSKRKSSTAGNKTVQLHNVPETGEYKGSEGRSGVSMGANFSRHSSKGLGRRCQSASNICPTKDYAFFESSGREVDAGYKFCNSLPSPTNGTVYNNNYEHKTIAKQTSLQHTNPQHKECQPLQWKFTDSQHTQYDQGYGSERSPEEETPLPMSSCEHTIDFCYSSYPFITSENTFEVELVKSSRGLGLSVCGGIDSVGSWPGLLRIKRLFPHRPAAASGLLCVGDLLLEANGISLTGLSNYEALDVLRMTPNKVVLLVCRPPPEILCTMSPISDVPPPPPRRTHSPSSSGARGTDADEYETTEFEIVLYKVNGSLGFTLCKDEDETDGASSGHCVRALVREPAISDGRIRPGDKIIAVNGMEISSLSHEQAVQFLRQCGNEVVLRLCRESNLSPTEITPNSSFRPKPNLRQEAVDMLSDLAARKLVTGSPCTSPRHQKRRLTDSHAAEVQKEKDFDDDEDDDDENKAVRPCFLDLYNPNQTPVAVRKTKFNLSLAHNAYELNNLDPEMLDAPNLSYECSDTVDEPVSMPPLSSGSQRSTNFSHAKPTYQSAHPQIVDAPNKPEQKNHLTKWKGVVFSAERDLLENDAQVLSIELNRGWNSRLGFSLQEVDGCPCVSAVYADSVAAKDGRLRPGDCLLTVNDEMVENMKTNDVIDLLRIIRGPVCMTVLRRKQRSD